MAIPFSILDLAPIVEGGTAAAALQNSLDLARHAERFGYHRGFCLLGLGLRLLIVAHYGGR